MAAMLGGACIASTHWPGAHVRWAWLAAAALAQLRLLANLFDGMVAIHRRIASPVGELYNEVPDRVSDAALFVGLGYAAGGSPLWGWAAALVAVLTAYIRAAVKVAGAPQDYCGPMAKPQRMAVLIGLGVYMAAAPSAWQPVREIGANVYGLASASLLVITLGGLLTAIRRLRRAAAWLQGRASS